MASGTRRCDNQPTSEGKRHNSITYRGLQGGERRILYIQLCPPPPPPDTSHYVLLLGDIIWADHDFVLEVAKWPLALLGLGARPARGFKAKNTRPDLQNKTCPSGCQSKDVGDKAPLSLLTTALTTLHNGYITPDSPSPQNVT